MNLVVADISISLDGYTTAAGQTADEPMGSGGERLHEWTTSEEGQRLLGETVVDLGAVIAGRRTYDDSVRWWGADGPTGPARRPVIVLSHDAPAEPPQDGVYRFVSGGVVDALGRAQVAAGDGTVCVMGGADTIRQFLNAGLVHELSLHVAPVLLGDGTRLFDGAPEHLVGLERISVLDTPTAVHARYRVVTPG